MSWWRKREDDKCNTVLCNGCKLARWVKVVVRFINIKYDPIKFSPLGIVQKNLRIISLCLFENLV